MNAVVLHSIAVHFPLNACGLGGLFVLSLPKRSLCAFAAQALIACFRCSSAHCVLSLATLFAHVALELNTLNILLVVCSSLCCPQDDSTADWFASLDQALGFNTRILQRVSERRRSVAYSGWAIVVT